MPFISDAMREVAKGYRTRAGVDLRYFASGHREVPWAGWKVDTARDSWSGYGAWNDWSGFGIFMLAHELGLPIDVSAKVGDLNESDIPIGSDRTFSWRDRTYGYHRRLTNITGSFYGPGGVEAAGIFEAVLGRIAGTDGALDRYGAFGARRVDEPQ